MGRGGEVSPRFPTQDCPTQLARAVPNPKVKLRDLCIIEAGFIWNGVEVLCALIPFQPIELLTFIGPPDPPPQHIPQLS